jgi:hypothetical protein
MRGEVASLAQPAFSSDIRAVLQAPRERNERCLVVGNLRSYGDEVLNSDGHYLQTTRCDRILELDAGVGAVTVEAGVTLDTLQRRFAPLGFMLPVTPGTAFITVGGAIANDVHGKNQGTAGTFGCHVDSLQLARTDGALLNCSRTENAEGRHPWRHRFRRPSPGASSAAHHLDLRTTRAASPISAILRTRRRAHAGHEYNVAWIDCLASSRARPRRLQLGRSSDPATQSG